MIHQKSMKTAKVFSCLTFVAYCSTKKLRMHACVHKILFTALPMYVRGYDIHLHTTASDFTLCKLARIQVLWNFVKYKYKYILPQKCT